VGPAAGGGRGPVNPTALTVEQLARAVGVSVDTVRRHVEDGAPASADGRLNLIHYAAWLNQRLRDIDGD
jgi:excisionase family DNA binding protein